MRTFFLLLFSCLASHGALSEVPQTRRSHSAIERVNPALQSELSRLKLAYGSDVFIQITKIPNELNLYLKTTSGRYRLYKTYPICAYSGGLGPKKRQGDGKSPEGFYTVRPSQMNPASSYHLSFNLGYPNAYDRSRGYTGDFLMVHGRCASIGCYAMTDPAIEEIWTLMSAAFDAGQTEIPVHIFPYKLNWPLRTALPYHPDRAFWTQLSPAWRAFAETKIPPKISVADGQYVVSERQP